MTQYKASQTFVNGKLSGIQCMRAVAALMVVLHHASEQLDGGRQFTNGFGQAGVDIFFVISGFIMYYVTERTRIAPILFILSRFKRIVPIYWFYTTLVVGLSLVFPSVFRESMFDLWHATASFLFIFYQNPANGSISPILRVGWTLNYEMIFYVLFAIGIWISYPARAWVAGTAIVALVASVIVFPGHGVIDLMYRHEIMLEFVFGSILGWAFVNQRLPTLGPTVGWVTIGGCLLAIVLIAPSFGVLPRSMIFGIPATVLLSSILCVRIKAYGKIARVGLALGNASYSIYLTHPFVLSALRLSWTRIGLPQAGLEAQMLFISTAIISSSLCGYAAYRLLEVPLTRRLHGKRTALRIGAA